MTAEDLEPLPDKVPERANLPKRISKQVLDKLPQQTPPYAWAWNPETQQNEPIFNDTTAGASITGLENVSAEVHNRAFGFLLLSILLDKPDVYQVNIFKQLTQYGITITLKQRVAKKPGEWQPKGLAAIGFHAKVESPLGSGKMVDAIVGVGPEQFSQPEPERRTITGWGKSFLIAILNALNEFEEWVERPKRQENK